VTARVRLVILVVVIFLTTAIIYLQVAVLRPRLWPAGAGLVLSGDAVMGALAEPAAFGVPRLPDIRLAMGQPVVVSRVWPGGAADRAGLTPGALVSSVEDSAGHRVALGDRLPSTPLGVLDIWRQMSALAATGPLTMEVISGDGSPRRVTVARPAIWSLDGTTFETWLTPYHFFPIAKLIAYTLAGLLVVALGANGTSARLMTMAFLLMGVADAGLLLGAERSLPPLAAILLAFTWLVAPFTLPMIGTAVLYFPTRAPVLDRRRWILPLLWVLPTPLLVLGLSVTAYLLGAESVGPVVAWLAARPAVFTLWFAVGILLNLALIGHAVYRYKHSPDAQERQRVQVTMFTGAPAAMAYAVLVAAPLVADLAGMPFAWPGPVALVLQLLVLLSAVGFAYAVAVRRALSPRTVIRQGLHYAMARKTLALLTALPTILLLASLVGQRDRPLAAIIEARPLFYLSALLLAGLGLRYRDAATRRLDQKFFRSEYDAREILLSLTSRIPGESDPRALVSLVLGDIRAALHPQHAAVLAGSGDSYETVHAEGPAPATLRGTSGLAQLLQWSDTPLEVTLHDQRSPAARLPAADRDWLETAGAVLLVPIAAGTGPERPLVGFIVLGPKKSEEPYSNEDRKLLGSIAAQMGVALDLSRLRREAIATPRGSGSTPHTFIESPRRGIDVGMTIEGKYRVDALIGRGGMGAVYRARDLGLDRDVAVKVVRGELVASPEARDRFRREAQLAARLQHPAIVTVFDYGTLPDGAAYLVMEYVRGEDLRSRLSKGPLPPAEAIDLLAAIAEGVEAAHRESVLHRDLKPENVLLPARGGPKVLDFGVAKAMPLAGMDATLTASGTIVGTPAYMAPEQIRGERVDARTDIFSLAVMCYEMLTGRLPFGAGSFVDVAMRQTSATPAIDEDGVPERVSEVLRRALSYARDDRQATALTLARELREALGE
jgi:GAF domain-containing protein/predicted Ser/Thr protein kinase